MKFNVMGGYRGAKPRYRYRVWSGGKELKFITLGGARSYAEAVFVTTGEIVAITEIKPRKILVDNRDKL